MIRPCAQAPIYTEATEDHFVFLGEGFHVRLPTPPQMHNKVTIYYYFIIIITENYEYP